MTVITVENLSDAQSFVALLRRSNPRWQGADESETGWIFRGQGDAVWSLLPSAFRPVRPESLLDSYLAHHRKTMSTIDWQSWISKQTVPPSCAPDQLREVALEALTHATLVRQFVLLADDVRHRVVVQPMLWHLFAQTRPEFGCYICGDIEDDVAQLFAIAQHHGVPTQFLDWTFNPLVAAYFAAEEAAGSAASGSIAVWALRNKLFDVSWSLERLTVPAGVTPFLDAQAGLFTWHPAAYYRRATAGAYVPFDQLVDELNAVPEFGSTPRPFLYKITLPRTEVPSLLKLLWRERVTPAHLMPTFDHVTRALTVRSKWLDK